MNVYEKWSWDYETDYYQIFNDEHSICITAPHTKENSDEIRELVALLNAVKSVEQTTVAPIERCPKCGTLFLLIQVHGE